MKFFALLKKITKLRYAFGLFCVGLFFAIGASIAAVSIQKASSSMVKTTATIDAIVVTPVTEEQNEYDVTLTFTLEDGTSYTAHTSNYSSSWKENQTITISYDPSDPDRISLPSTNWIPYAVIAVGAVCVVYGGVRTVMIAKTSSADMDDTNRVNMAEVSPAQIDEVRNSTEPKKSYFARQKGALCNDCLLETPEGEVVAEFHCNQYNVLGNSDYTYTNHRSGKTVAMKIGKPVTVEYGDNNPVNFLTDAYIKMDGKKCWEILGEMGYSFDIRFDGLKPAATLKKYGVEVADIVADYTHTSGGKKAMVRVGNACNITCRESDIDGVLLFAFAMMKIM